MFFFDVGHSVLFSFGIILLRMKELVALPVVRPTGVYLLDYFCFNIQFYLLLNPYLCFISFLYLELYALGDDALIS